MNYGRLSLTCYRGCVHLKLTVKGWRVRRSFSQSSGANKIITEQVNYAFIGPHSGGSLWRFPQNHFCLRNAPRSTTCTMVFIPLPPFTSNYRATSRSGSIIDLRSISPLFFIHRIKRHVPNFAERPHLIKRASSHCGFIHDRRCNPPLFPRR